MGSPPCCHSKAGPDPGSPNDWEAKFWHHPPAHFLVCRRPPNRHQRRRLDWSGENMGIYFTEGLHDAEHVLHINHISPIFAKSIKVWSQVDKVSTNIHR